MSIHPSICPSIRRLELVQDREAEVKVLGGQPRHFFPSMLTPISSESPESPFGGKPSQEGS